MKLDPSLAAHIQIHPKWIRALNVQSEAPKLLDERIGSTHKDASSGKDFLSRILVAQEIGSTLKKWDFVKFQSFSDNRKLLID